MKCIIIEDQQPAQRILKKYIEDFGSLHLVNIFSNAIDATEFLKNNTVDVIFLDIHLPKLSGIEFLKTIAPSADVILTTAFTHYAIESYELNVVDYLLKPFSYQRFVQAVNKVQEKQQRLATTPNTKNIYIKSGYDLINIRLDDILYIKSDTDYTEFYLIDKKHLSSEPLRYWEQELANYLFKRIHKSYIVNTHKIEKIGTQQIVLKDDTLIPIGRTYKEDFFKEFRK